MPTKLVHTNGYYGEDTGKHPVWVEAQEQPFIITLTPTSDDLSGTMDKTPAEIWEAYKAGYRFEFYISTIGNGHCAVTQTMEVDADEDGEYDCVVLQSNVVYALEDMSYPVLIEIITQTDSATYDTHMHTLTPAE